MVETRETRNRVWSIASAGLSAQIFMATFQVMLGISQMTPAIPRASVRAQGENIRLVLWAEAHLRDTAVRYTA
jgi:hypothetical protein